jgi:hypothetical protein
MIRFKAHAGDKTLIGLGLTRVNIERLMAGEPIHVKGETVDNPGQDILIIFGEDIDSLTKQLSPMIGTETKVTVDPKLKEIPENVRSSKLRTTGEK